MPTINVTLGVLSASWQAFETGNVREKYECTLYASHLCVGKVPSRTVEGDRNNGYDTKQDEDETRNETTNGASPASSRRKLLFIPNVREQKRDERADRIGYATGDEYVVAGHGCPVVSIKSLVDICFDTGEADGHSDGESDGNQ